jgi:hypothetical protein
VIISKSADGTNHTTTFCISQQIFFKKLQQDAKKAVYDRRDNDLVVA